MITAEQALKRYEQELIRTINKKAKWETKKLKEINKILNKIDKKRKRTFTKSLVRSRV